MIPLFKVLMSEDHYELNKVLDSGSITQGPKVEEFEKLLKTHFKNENVLTLNSCTSAIHLALHVIKEEISREKKYIYRGDLGKLEVIASPVTCTAGISPIVLNGMGIKWADIDPLTMNVDLNDVRAKLDISTRILSFVHWGGNPINYDMLFSLQDYYEKKFGFPLYIIEDCAHVWNARYKGEVVGGTGRTFACFSFQAIKYLTCGDGGLLITPWESYKQAKLLRWFGLDREAKKDFRAGSDIESAGFKFHMNDINATIALNNYSSAIMSVNRSRINAQKYDAEIKNDKIKLLNKERYGFPSPWLYTILVEDREIFIAYMEGKGIQCNPVHRRNDTLTCFAPYLPKEELKNLNEIDHKRVCIPVGWWLSLSDSEYIVKTVNEYK